MQVELIYEKTCPNIKAAREQLIKAFVETGMTPHWQEWEVSSPDSPSHVHGYGSPTVLINKKDVSGEIPEGDDYCCRVYHHNAEGNKGIPSLADITHAFIMASKAEATTEKTDSKLSLNTAIIPAVGVALLPKLVCPACWPAYAGLLSAMGLSFVDYTPYLLPFTAIFLIIAVTALGYGATKRRGYKPFMSGLIASIILLAGKFYFESDTAMYVGLTLLVMASLWNTWPISIRKNTCSACNDLDEAQAKQA